MATPRAKVTRTKFFFKKDLEYMLGIKDWKAGQLIKQLNDELESKGYIVIPGRVSAKYACERLDIYFDEE